MSAQLLSQAADIEDGHKDPASPAADLEQEQPPQPPIYGSSLEHLQLDEPPHPPPDPHLGDGGAGLAHLTHDPLQCLLQPPLQGNHAQQAVGDAAVALAPSVGEAQAAIGSDTAAGGAQAAFVLRLVSSPRVMSIQVRTCVHGHILTYMYNQKCACTRAYIWACMHQLHHIHLNGHASSTAEAKAGARSIEADEAGAHSIKAQEAGAHSMKAHEAGAHSMKACEAGARSITAAPHQTSHPHIPS